MIGYSLTKQADSQLRKFPVSVQRFIIKKIKHYCSTDNPLHYADAIEGEKGKVYRFRIGDYRTIFDWEGGHILITKIDDRKDIYKGR